MNERSRLWFINWPLIGVVSLLSVYGAVMVQSATAGMTGGPGLFRRHLIGLAIGLVPLGVAWAFDYRKVAGWVGPLLILDALLILSPKIPGLGTTAKGATSWLALGGIRLFQPSEPAKLVTIMIMAVVIASYKGKIEHGRDLLKVLGILAIPLGLILLQPDLGTGMVFVAITAGMLLIGGLKPRWFLVLAIAGALLVGMLFGVNEALNRTLHRGNYDPAYIAAVASGSADQLNAVSDNSVLIKRYQINRLLVFLDPSRDPSGAGYNLEQSKIAIGSGELTGKGLKDRSTQSNLRFLPEPHTDFIFSVTGEQLGFMGGLLLLGLYLALLVTALEIAAQSRDLLGSLIVAGVISMWTFQILENMGMTMGLMPITGIPLPFMSFGSSFMVTNMAAVGMLLSVWTRRQGVPGI
ncbi:MAG: rod shape-determining protein RodA [Coriobacteriia bacterium]|nr:rod shape-determining protein RodA [Coriobacteriia bacterium]